MVSVKAKLTNGAQRVIDKRDIADNQAVLVTYVDGVINFYTLAADDPAIASLAKTLVDTENG